MSQYLGDISAYALAVSQGYTGTEEEYAELMASYATVGQTAVTAAQTATTKASEAATSATTATNKASEATTAATTATNKAAEAQADADAAALDASQALSAASTATTKATEATTAAATATSAATTATTAKDDAVSAKTAAQTAQTGAETAAASVEASAEQIATNAADISQLKSEFTDVNADVLSLQGGDYNLVFEQGAIGGDGRPFSSTKDIRTGFIKVPPSSYTVIPNISGIIMYVLFYDASKTYLNKNVWAKTATFNFDVPVGSDIAYARFTCKYQNNTDIAPVDNAMILHNSGIYADVQNVIDENPSIPSYYKGAYLDEKIAAIYDNSIVTSGTTFAFITDIHMADNMKSSKALMKYILDNAPVPFVISGGDIVTAYSKTVGNEKAEVYDAAQKWLDWVTYWGQDRVYQLRGNHDYVIVANNDSSKYYNMPLGGVHQFVMSKFVDRVNCPANNYNYYYFDNEVQKIRYIVIDGHTYSSDYPRSVVSWINPSQINWLIDVLNNSDGYSIVLISHEATDSNMASYASNLAIVQTIAEAYANRGTVSQVASGASITANFTNATGTLVCILSGHSHRDQSHYQNGVLSISTTCDAVYNNDPNVTRTKGTISESAFDVFSIDTTAKTIKTVRIGGGNDRGWNYETGAELTE